MDTAVADVARWRFSTDALPEHERGAALHALSGCTLVALEALPDVPVYADFTSRRLPGLGLQTGAMEAVRVERSRRHLADGVADLVLSVPLSGDRGVVCSGRGREVILHPGDAVLWSCAEPHVCRPMIACERGRFLALLLLRAAVAPLVTNIDDAVLRLIPASTGALKLLLNYVGMLEDDEALATPELRRLVVTQIYDLAALAMGATRDAAAIAEGRGVRAARLRAIKADIAERLAQDDLTVAAVA
jgi:hypothetical protein